MTRMHFLAELFLAGLVIYALAGSVSGQEFDLVIRGGRIVDGTGNPWRGGDVAIRGQRIAAIGRILTGAGNEEEDA